MKSLTTNDVAQLTGITRVALERWLTTGKLKEPQKLHRLRIWTPADVARVKKFVEIVKHQRLRGRPLGGQNSGYHYHGL